MREIRVTSPLMPDIDDYKNYLDEIWANKWLTNNGKFHKTLECELCNYMQAQYISLVSNGTLALSLAIRALDLTGEVITTPYSFVATSHALALNNLTPVFVDIDPETLNIDPESVRKAITPNTSAILAVHVYGRPCNNAVLQQIAKEENLKLVYDAAHAFGVLEDDQAITNWGDLSILSFHATKVFSTIEGGAIICKDKETKDKLDRLKNFGYQSEEEIIEIGTNAKLNEFQCAFGLANLKTVDQAIDYRSQLAHRYYEELSNIDGLTLYEFSSNVRSNYSYFPIHISENIFGKSRDEVLNDLKEKGIYCRRYFYPLITDFDCYKNSSDIISHDLENSREVSQGILCLPIHQDITIEDVTYICNLIKG